jgi:hypothetical protein
MKIPQEIIISTALVPQFAKNTLVLAQNGASTIAARIKKTPAKWYTQKNLVFLTDIPSLAMFLPRQRCPISLSGIYSSHILRPKNALYEYKFILTDLYRLVKQIRNQIVI